MNENNKAVRFKDLSATCILRMLLRNWWMIILSALTVSMATSLFLQYTYVPRYRASMTYAVTARKSSAVTNTNVTVTKDVAEVLAELLETDVINNKVRDSSESLAAFGGTFSASQVSGSNFINVSCTDVTPKSAFTALDKLTELFPEIADYISKNTVLQIIKNPAVSSNPINAIDVSRYEKLGAIGGAVLMIGLLVLMNIKRETVQTVSGAKHLVDASIIAVLGHERKVRTFRDLTRHKKTSVLITAPTVTSRYSEQVNTICSKLEHEHNEHGSRIFIVTGVGEDEGKSTVSANVALMLALKGKKVALVDGDFRKPAMNKIFDGAYKSQLPLNHMLKQPFSKENFLACIVRNPDNGLYMCFSDGGYNIPASEKVRQPDVVAEIAGPVRIRQIGMSAHGNRIQPCIRQHVLNPKQPAQRLVRKHMFRPALGCRQFDIAESGIRDTADRLFNRKTVIGVGIDCNNLFHIIFLIR